jgi:hypothetical protein
MPDKALTKMLARPYTQSNQTSCTASASQYQIPSKKLVPLTHVNLSAVQITATAASMSPLRNAATMASYAVTA